MRAGERSAALAELIVDVPDFPKPGIAFKDITPLLADPAAFGWAIEDLAGLAPTGVDLIVGMEARGFLFAAPLALQLAVGFAPVRKAGKLPRETIEASYSLEYRSEVLALHADAVRPGQRVLIVDDVLATGGTALATRDLVTRLGGTVVGVLVLVELSYLGGRRRLAEAGLNELHAVLEVARP
jgi:adenine phosphoribosyltransferase